MVTETTNMISDILFDAIERIDWYLDEYKDLYTGDIRARIIEVRDVMHELRDELDTLPDEATTHVKEGDG